MNKSLSLFIAVYRFNIYHLFFQLEDDTDPDQGRSVVVIFDFEVSDNTTSVSTALRPYDDYEDENSIPEMPWLDIAVADCNCSRYPELSDVAVRLGANIEAHEHDQAIPIQMIQASMSRNQKRKTHQAKPAPLKLKKKLFIPSTSNLKVVHTTNISRPPLDTAKLSLGTRLKFSSNWR